jgi:PEGA domain
MCDVKFMGRRSILLITFLLLSILIVVIPVSADSDFITIDPIGDRHAGDVFTITAETNLSENTIVTVQITDSSNTNGAMGQVKPVTGTSGMNKISFDIATSTFAPGIYTVTMRSPTGVSGTAQFTVLGTTPAPTLSPTIPATTIPTPVAVNYSVGSLGVTSSPPGADIYVDDTYRGITPLLVEDLTPGSHAIRITKAGYNDYTYTGIAVGGQSRWRGAEVILTPGTGVSTTPPADSTATGAVTLSPGQQPNPTTTTTQPARSPIGLEMVISAIGISAAFLLNTRRK